MNLLWFFLPDEALILVVVALGIGVMVRLVRGRTVLAVLGGIALTAVATSFLEAFLGGLPLWITLLVVAFIGFWLLREVSALFLGRGASEAMAGRLAADAVRLFFRMLFFPLAVAWRLVRRYP